ncbi:hypothetical protein KIW84_023191 [Lathyrus oleraceus]|uniref:Condensin complex subunit 2 n=1 Tax=Pisum sativum TaxID=3888 RepID=A0A9D4YEX5_PEA|nr:hypothetical protein KIW84_023191 [Pisum sativum]
MNKSLIISILTHRNASQRKAIRETYAQTHGEDLLKDLDKELSSDFEKVVLLWTLDPAERDAFLANQAVNNNVQALKVTLWDEVQASTKFTVVQDQEEVIYFKNLLANFPAECNVAANISDISPHLCFICLLHLANENGLRLQGFPNLDNLSIFLPHDVEPELLSGTV